MFKNIFLITIIALLLMSVTINAQAYKDRVDKISPAANAAALGETINVLKKALEGQDVLFEQPTLTYGWGASDTVKVQVYSTNSTLSQDSSILMYFDRSAVVIPDTVFAFTATTHDVDSSKYGAFKFSIGSDSSLTVSMSAATYATFDSAYAAVPATPANKVTVGYAIVYASGALFNATTTKLNASTVSVFYFPATSYIRSWE